MTLANNHDHAAPIDCEMDLEMDQEDINQEVREIRLAERQQQIDERLHQNLQWIDDLMIRGLGDLDIAYQWINDRPKYERRTSEYDPYPDRGPLIIKPRDLTRKFFMPEGYWCLLETAAMEVFEPELRRAAANAHKWHEGDRQMEISNVLDTAIQQSWFICVLGHRQALSETQPSAYLEIRECWCSELMDHLFRLLLKGSEEMRLQCVEPYSLMRTMLPVRSRLHIHISALNTCAQAQKAWVLKEIELQKERAALKPAD